MYSPKLSRFHLGVFASSRLAGRGGSPVPPYPPPQPPVSNNLKSTLTGRGGAPRPPLPARPTPPNSGLRWVPLSFSGTVLRGTGPMPPLPPRPIGPDPGSRKWTTPAYSETVLRGTGPMPPLPPRPTPPYTRAICSRGPSQGGERHCTLSRGSAGRLQRPLSKRCSKQEESVRTFLLLPC
jgi:hypothetical protein